MSKFELIDLKTFIKHQFIKNDFKRVDMLVRYYSIENYMDDENYDFALYKKMRVMISFEEKKAIKLEFIIEKFKNLIKSFKKNGFDTSHPILCRNRHPDWPYGIVDGAHRLSLAYFYKLESIPIKTLPRETPFQRSLPLSFSRKYNFKWFKDRGFNEKELSIINKKTEQMKKYIDFNNNEKI